MYGLGGPEDCWMMMLEQSGLPCIQAARGGHGRTQQRSAFAQQCAVWHTLRNFWTLIITKMNVTLTLSCSGVTFEGRWRNGCGTQYNSVLIWGLTVCKQVFREPSLSTRFELPSLLKSRPSHLTSSLGHLFLKQKLQFLSLLVFKFGRQNIQFPS